MQSTPKNNNAKLKNCAISGILLKQNAMKKSVIASESK